MKSAHIVFDGHNDTLSWLKRRRRPVTEAFFDNKGTGHLDLKRARQGGLGGGLFACFVPSMEPRKKRRSQPPRPVGLARAQRYSMALAADLYRVEAAAEGAVKVIHSMQELTACLENAIFAAVLHFEGAEAIDRDLDALEVFYRAGLRSLGLVWSRPNAFGHGVRFAYPHSPDTGPGLTGEGFALVKACNRLGIMIDLSHITEKGFWDVAATSEAPLVATHSNAHAVCPCSRNLTDKQLDAIRDSGGVTGINFATCFLRPDGKDRQDTPLKDIVRHIDYIVDRIGIDHVAFGSDFNGATVPRVVGDVTGYMKIMKRLQQRGYGEEDLDKLAWSNWLRVLEATWK